MNYAIIDGTTVKSTGTFQELFPDTSFSATGINADFLKDNNVVEIIEALDCTEPTQKVITVSPYYVQSEDKVYTVKVESTTADEQTTLINQQWENIRVERDSKLLATDWRASSDLTLSDAWKNYRQALRDITTQSDPFNITWPTKPS